MTVRSVIERMARGRKFKRRLPNGAPIWVSPDAQLKYVGRAFDRDLTTFAAEHVDERSVVWDVGANCGVFAFSSLEARQIVAIEADPFMCTLLQESNGLNGNRVSLLSAAAYSAPGLAEFSIAARGRASNHLASVAGSTQTGGERARLHVPLVTLDSLLDHFLPPTLIKIDVEGAEADVLCGASRVLREARPFIYLETIDETHGACETLLAEHDYTLTKGSEQNWLCRPR